LDGMKWHLAKNSSCSRQWLCAIFSRFHFACLEYVGLGRGLELHRSAFGPLIDAIGCGKFKIYW